MASSPSDSVIWPTNYVPPDVQFILQWNPGELLPAADKLRTVQMASPGAEYSPLEPSIPSVNMASHSMSGVRSTRRAAFYDRHLARHLVLRRIVHLDSLIDSVVGTVDAAIRAAFEKGIELPPEEDVPKTRRTIEKEMRGFDGWVYREQGVAHHYFQFAAQYCLPIASTLALHPSHPEWTSLLGWTPDVKAGKWAIADGVLRFKGISAKNAEYHKEILESIGRYEPEKKVLVEKLMSQSDELAIWEMKSLQVGPAAVMESILLMGQEKKEFMWTECESRPCEHERVVEMKEAWPEYDRGFDSISPPWTLPPADLITSAVYSPPISRGRDLRNASRPSTEAGPSRLGNSPSPAPSMSSIIHRVKSVRSRKKKGKRLAAASDTESVGKRGTPLAKKHKPGDENKNQPEPKPGEQREVNAQSFLQQVCSSNSFIWCLLDRCLLLLVLGPGCA
jgi:hypothetical protein